MKFLLRVFLLVVISTLFSHGQENAASSLPPEQLYREGIGAFEFGDYPKAISLLQETIKLTESPESLKALEPAFYTIAAAYYNLREYDKSIESFKLYKTKYPEGLRLADATLSIANAHLSLKQYPQALDVLRTLENNTSLADFVYFIQGAIHYEQKKFEQAIPPLEKLISRETITSIQLKGSILLVSAYAKKGRYDKINSTLAFIQKNIEHVENLVQFNNVAIEIGNQLLEEGFPRQALAMFQIARTKEALIEAQTKRIERLKTSLEKNLQQFRATRDLGLIRFGDYIRSAIRENTQTLRDFETLPSLEPGLLLRYAACYQEAGKPWHAAIVYNRLLEKFPDAKETESALFSSILVFAEAGYPTQALKNAEHYLEKFPDNEKISTVQYFRGSLALEARQYEKAIHFFGIALQQPGENLHRGSIRFLLANARFSSGDYEGALKDYAEYIKESPDGNYREEAEYRIGITKLFSGNYKDAREHLENYLKNYPKGPFNPDARYRLIVCDYADADYQNALESCSRWRKDFASDPQLAEVIAMEADIYIATNERAKAIDAYIESYQKASTDEVLTYSLFEAGKLLQKQRDWPRLAHTFEEFIWKHPDHTAVVGAAVFLSQARMKEGKLDEARQFIAQTIQKYIGNPANGNVEKLLSQLATLYMKSRDEDPVAQIWNLLTAEQTTPTVETRKLFAIAEYFKMRRDQESEQKYIANIAENFFPKDLSPLLLGLSGEWLMRNAREEKGSLMFQHLIDYYPLSEYADYGFVGMGELYFSKKDYSRALAYFTKALDEISPVARLKEATLGKAKTLLALEQFDEAQKLFEQAASIREWRGPDTAFAIYSLGKIEEKQKEYAKAIAYYQRVYVAYQRYPEWMARAYLDSAFCFEQLGEMGKAINTYEQMLMNPKLQGQPAVRDAEARLQKLRKS